MCVGVCNCDVIGRKKWRDIVNIPFIKPYQSVGGLVFEAKTVYEPVLEVFQHAVVVPPLFHAYTKIQFYVISCFCRELRITFKQFFDAMRAQTHEKSSNSAVTISSSSAAHVAPRILINA